jgi:hypothetical protein
MELQAGLDVSFGFRNEYSRTQKKLLYSYPQTQNTTRFLFGGIKGAHMPHIRTRSPFAINS